MDHREIPQSDTTRARPLHAHVQDHVRIAPDAPAIRDGALSLSYRALDGWANAVAGELTKLGVRPGDRVALALERSAVAVCAMLAAMKTGAVYVPVDLAYPAERIRFMLEDCQCAAILTDGSRALEAPGVPALNLSAEEATTAPAVSPPDRIVGPDDPVYMIYTSGSTGRPKGVPILHRGVHGLLFGNDYYTAGPGDRFLQTAPIAFDASVFDIWGALANGAELVFYRERIPTAATLGAAIAEHRITTLWLTPSVFNGIAAEDPAVFAGVRQLVLGGEPLSPHHVRLVYDAVAGITVINGYGPTENSDFTCCYRVPRNLPADALRIPVGSPIGGDDLLILDDHGQPVRDGETGVLHIAGSRLTPGYHNRPELTEAAFRPHPRDPARRIYATGDLARLTEQGLYDVLGRRDDQVKVRGHRVELPEINSALERHPAIRQAACALAALPSGENGLCAYVVAEAGAAPTTGDLRRFLAQSLPDYMVPSLFLTLASLPLTPNGKLDRTALPASGEARHLPAGGSGDGPRPGMETRIALIWSQCLGVADCGRAQTFFELGGTSLLLARVQQALESELRTKIPITDLFDRPRLKDLAAHLQSRLSSENEQATQAEARSDGTTALRRRLDRRLRARSRAPRLSETGHDA
jgi:amino acid adenylation domain-containing protein